jgi:hypothetical protein
MKSTGEEGGVSETPSYSPGWVGFLFALDSVSTFRVLFFV